MPEDPERGGALADRPAILASPGSCGYVDAGALELYCERHGDGHPLVLLPGTSHEGVLDRVEWLPSMITRFLMPPPPHGGAQFPGQRS